MRATFEAFPMPPSINEAYGNNYGCGRGRFKTQAYKSFSNQVQFWKVRNQLAVSLAKSMVSRLGPGQALHLSRAFYFRPERVITLSGKPKRCDTANFIKCLDDELAGILEIDDCYFWDGSEHKLMTLTPQHPERVDILLSVMAIPTLSNEHTIGRLPERKRTKSTPDRV